ncbi:hypothetical protein [Variovorax terrae]|uniref:Uncharacterized protein n=1 Tax=Variovorax terrae TaxID=2923278 RepID=A0A9X2AMC9_9BURK|nr:hypothetical protein [Variovorax terrae]MCJ0762590.1 hypothetical protein [Variovorax terrae]
MSYTLTLYAFEDATDEQRREAEQRFREALDAALGDASLVAPVYAAYLKIVAAHGEAPAPDALTAAERELLAHWQAAESAAVTAAFGPNRYMGEAQFEIGI